MARFKIAFLLMEGEKLPDPLDGTQLTRPVRTSSSLDIQEIKEMTGGMVEPGEKGRLFFSQIISSTGTSWVEGLPGIKLLGSRKLTPA